MNFSLIPTALDSSKTLNRVSIIAEPWIKLYFHCYYIFANSQSIFESLSLYGSTNSQNLSVVKPSVTIAIVLSNLLVLLFGYGRLNAYPSNLTILCIIVKLIIFPIN